MGNPAAPLNGHPQAADGAPAQDAQPVPAARTLSSEELLQGGRSVAIRHNGAVYRLQATRQGKLILTK